MKFDTACFVRSGPFPHASNLINKNVAVHWIEMHLHVAYRGGYVRTFIYIPYGRLTGALVVLFNTPVVLL